MNLNFRLINSSKKIEIQLKHDWPPQQFLEEYSLQCRFENVDRRFVNTSSSEPKVHQMMAQNR
jgi:hypothetical protein